jgi:hypothetical protein
MNGQRGIEGLAAELGATAVGVVENDAAASGPGSYDAVVHELRLRADSPVLLQPLAKAWADRRFDDGHLRPLILLAALRARALEAPSAHPMALELLHDAVAPDLGARLEAALDDPGLIPLLATGTITHVDPSRAMLHGLPALITGLQHRGFDIVERFATAGLSLVIDRTAIPFRFGANLVQGFDFPAPEHRLGFDPAPLDLTGPNAESTLRWLHACIWPGETERLSRLKATLTHRTNRWRGDSPAPDVIATPNMRWPDLLAMPALATIVAAAARPILFYDATRPLVTSPALPPTDDTADGPFEALKTIPASLWAMLVRTGLQGARALRLDVILYRSGAWQRVTLGETGFHSGSLTLDLTGPARLQALWNLAP